jgi:hypothetical protein
MSCHVMSYHVVSCYFISWNVKWFMSWYMMKLKEEERMKFWYIRMI